MRPYQFPLSVSRDWYVTEVGGHTQELSPGEIGINVDALKQNTSLEGGEMVQLRPFEDSPHPFFRRRRYEVVPLGDEHSDGVQLSRNGEAALPLEEGGLSTRDEIIINSIILPGRGPSGY